ncbi:hypothetical protein NE237_009048 [Protea cynaroides]|uniref:Myb-like domain-containing protein n=1 Tax=Protea cynaroides TaxID=273540 RepID=A0A9Q0QZX8_9MAGN|nr:hypothetical protein NE237_009048 [Protea cynaroides]
MASSSSSSSKLAWIWCIEALADFTPVDTSLLRDVINAAPELSDQLSGTARERVALRCLEQWLSVHSASDRRVTSLTSESGFEAIDGVPERKSCEEVLRLVLNKSKISEILKQKVHQFILHKKDSLTGCALKQLKDAIVHGGDGTHPFSASVWKMNGLAKGNQNRSIIHVGEGDPTVTAKMHYIDDNEIQAPAKKALRPLSQRNGKELLAVGQEWDRSRLEEENQSKSIICKEGSQSFEPVMIHNNNGDNEIQAPPTNSIYLVYGGNEKELLHDQPRGNNTESAQCGMVNGKPVKRHLCLDDDQVDESHMSCTKDRGHHPSYLTSGTMSHESGNETLEVDPPDGITKSTKRGRNGFPKEPQLNFLAKSRIHAKSDRLANAKMAKYAHIQSVVQMSVLSHEDKREQEDLPSRTISSTEKCILTNEIQGQAPEGAEICRDGNEFLPLKRLRNGNVDCEIQHNMSWYDKNDKISLPSNQVVSQRNNFDHDEDNNEIIVSHPNGSKKNVSNETEDRHKRYDERKISSKNDGHSDKTLSLNVTDIMLIAQEKHRFLNSQSTYDHDHQATSSEQALRICCKCRKGGRLLICCVKSCQIVGHESCLGPPSGFDDKGNFYCPFCSCERTIIAYLDAKEEAALAMKQLVAFTSAKQSYQQKNKSGRSSQEPQSRKATDVEMSERNHDHGKQKEIISNQLMPVVEHQKKTEHVGRLLNEYICCTEAKASTGPERNVIVLNREYPNPIDNQQTKGVKKDQQSTKPLNACCNDDLSLREEKTVSITETLSVSVAMERGNANMPEEAQPIGGEEKKPKQKFACEEMSYTRTESASHKPPKHGNLNPMLQEQVVNPLPEPSSQPNVTANETFENDNVSSDDSSRSLRPVISRSFPVLSSRRKKVPWTAEEEDILVEGVRRFSSTDYKNVPWKKILEFGCHVFQKNRNPVDLKDKWRNICTRGDPRAGCK